MNLCQTFKFEVDGPLHTIMFDVQVAEVAPKLLADHAGGSVGMMRQRCVCVIIVGMMHDCWHLDAL